LVGGRGHVEPSLAETDGRIKAEGKGAYYWTSSQCRMTEGGKIRHFYISERYALAQAKMDSHFKEEGKKIDIPEPAKSNFYYTAKED